MCIRAAAAVAAVANVDSEMPDAVFALRRCLFVLFAGSKLLAAYEAEQSPGLSAHGQGCKQPLLSVKSAAPKARTTCEPLVLGHEPAGHR